jgi:hypothetical protein
MNALPRARPPRVTLPVPSRPHLRGATPRWRRRLSPGPAFPPLPAPLTHDQTGVAWLHYRLCRHTWSRR